MKKSIFGFCFFVILWSCNQTVQEEAHKVVEPAEITNGYDSILAAKVGADDYGMRQYVMAFLKAGPNRDQDSTTAANLQTAHLENIGRLAEAGKLSLAGPFMDNGEMRGIYIFNVTTIEEAKKLTETDPAIQAGRLEMELHPWYGSAALMEVNNLHNRLQKKDITE
jgi:uncharacterized protein YciI